MWNVEKEFTIKLGGNYYTNVPNIIVARGESLFRVNRREEDGLLAIDFDVYRADGTKVATIRNAHVMREEHEDYEYHKEKHRYWIIEKKSGRVICDIRQVTRAEKGAEIELTVDLYTKWGFRLIAGPDETNAPGATVRGSTIKNCSTGMTFW